MTNNPLIEAVEKLLDATGNLAYAECLVLIREHQAQAVDCIPIPVKYLHGTKFIDNMYSDTLSSHTPHPPVSGEVVERESIEHGLRAELAAHRAVSDAAAGLSRLMDEVEQDEAGQNDRVFAHFEFDQLRYALGLVQNLTGSAAALQQQPKEDV